VRDKEGVKILYCGSLKGIRSMKSSHASISRKKVITQLLLTNPIKTPVFHEVALKLQQMLARDDYSIENALRLINDDPGLSAEMLRHANSTYNSGAEAITTIKSAMIRLGSQQILNLAYSASLSSHRSFNSLINSTFLSLWTHSHIVAMSGSWLVLTLKKDSEQLNRFRTLNEEEVYLAGLFHSLGKFYLLKEIDELVNTGVLVIDEHSLLEISNDLNQRMGVKLIEKWSLPEIYGKVIEGKTGTDWEGKDNNLNNIIAIIRLCCKLHHFCKEGILVNASSEEYPQVEAECKHLGVTDLQKVSEVIKMLGEV
jgi:HD-like signal output (HDOD) protein